MVRAKASTDSLTTGLYFANAVSLERDSGDEYRHLIDRRGNATIFAVLKKCLPNLVDGCNRQALSEVQLNKFLVKNGYIPFRQRNRVKGTIDQWEKGQLRWKNRRWVNPADDHDLSHLKHCLSKLEFRIPSAKIDIDHVVSCLSAVVRGSPEVISLPRNRMWTNHRLILGETGMQPCPTLRLLRPEFAVLALSFYQVRAFALLND